MSPHILCSGAYGVQVAATLWVCCEIQIDIEQKELLTVSGFVCFLRVRTGRIKRGSLKFGVFLKRQGCSSGKVSFS